MRLLLSSHRCSSTQTRPFPVCSSTIMLRKNQICNPLVKMLLSLASAATHSHESRTVTSHARVTSQYDTHASRLLTLSQAGHMSHGPAGLFRPLWGNGKRTKAFKTTNPTDRSTFIIRCTRTFPSQLSISICDLQRKMRGASAALTSASAHPRAWRGEGERKRARVARAVNKSFVSPLRVIAYV